MLFLIGLGLSHSDITIGALDVCRRCELYVDRYTSRIDEKTAEYITNATGKKITEIARQEMEEASNEIIKAASTKDIAILIGGDPLIATTHKILIIEAGKMDVKTEILHANSIITAAMGESGLDFYRFGKTCTIPKWSERYKPVSFYQTIYSNLKNNAHTVLLLDYDQKTMSTMSISESVGILEECERRYKKGVITSGRSIIILHNMSNDGARAIFTTIGEAKTMDMDGVNVMVLHSDLTEIEKETIQALRKANK